VISQLAAKLRSKLRFLKRRAPTAPLYTELNYKKSSRFASSDANFP
jgi:hypothetical protein